MEYRIISYTLPPSDPAFKSRMHSVFAYFFSVQYVDLFGSALSEKKRKKKHCKKHCLFRGTTFCYLHSVDNVDINTLENYPVLLNHAGLVMTAGVAPL